MMVRTTRLLAMAGAGVLAAPLALAQSPWPRKSVSVVTGFAAGTSVDTMARLMAGKLAEGWKQTIVIEPVVGAAGNLAAERVAKASADGHTLLWSGNAALVVNPALYSRVGYVPQRDFAPISLIVESPNVLVVHPSLPARDVKNLIALARTHPGELTYGSAGVGTSTHIAGEMLRILAGVSLTHVPYKGGQGIIPDVVTGRIAMSFANIAGPAMPQVRDGKLRALAVTSARRSALLPELPTVAEAGLPGFEAVAWFGMLAPARTPVELIRRVHQDVVASLQSPDLRSRYAELGLEIVGNTPEQFADVIGRELPQWEKLIKAAGIKLDY